MEQNKKFAWIFTTKSSLLEEHHPQGRKTRATAPYSRLSPSDFLGGKFNKGEECRAGLGGSRTNMEPGCPLVVTWDMTASFAPPLCG